MAQSRIEDVTTFAAYLSNMLDGDSSKDEVDEQILLAIEALRDLSAEERKTAIASVHTGLAQSKHASAICAMLDIPLPTRSGDEMSAVLDVISTEVLNSIKDSSGIERDHALMTLMGNLALMSGLQFERWRTAILREKLMRAGVFDEEIASRRQELDTQNGTIEKKAKPPTWPYRVEGGRINYLFYRSGPDGTTLESNPVCDFSAIIRKEITDEGGEKTFAVAGIALRGGAFEFEIAAEDFGNDRRLKAVLDAASGGRDPVRAGMGKHLSPSIQLLTGDDMKQLRRFRRTGWVGDTFLIPGRERDGDLIELPRKLPYRVKPDADFNLGIKALEHLALAMEPERATIAIAAMFQAPLAHIANWQNERYAVFISGRTGSLKTSFAQVLMCLYGPDFIRDELLVKWGEGATSNAMMGMAVHAQDMPFLIDNFKPTTGGGTRAFITLIHNIVEGGEKDRLNRASELRDTRPIFCWPICTGEDVPDSDPSSLARILVVPFKWQRGEDNHDLTAAQDLSEHLCAVGNAWIEWLETEEGQEIASRIAAKFPMRRSHWAAILKEIRKDSVNILRVASNLASNELTWQIMQEHPQIGPLANQAALDHSNGLSNIVALAMAEATAEALEATRFLSALQELLTTERVVVLPRTQVIPVSDIDKTRDRDRYIGWVDDEGFYLLPAVTRRAVNQLLGDGLNGISNAMLYKQLDELCYIKSRNKNEATKTIRIENKTKRVLHLTLESLNPADDIEDGKTIGQTMPF